jgi:acetylornithine deacetylase/succinyl-diaminopimelate desuccinylase-like protein
MFLKQSTASQSRNVGPFVDDTDFKTLETGLTINNTDVKLCKNGGTSGNKNSGGGTHRVNGHYSLTFDATDTDTVGELSVSIAVSGALIVTAKFFVVEEAVYDAQYGASAIGYVANAPVNVAQISGDSGAADNLEAYTDGTTPMPVNATQISGDSGAADNAESFFDGTGYAGTGNVIPSVTTVTGNVNGSVGSLGATAKSDVNTEVQDVLNTDTTSEMGQAAPPASPTIREMLNYMYRRLTRSKITVDGSGSPTVETVFADNGSTALYKRNISDSGNITTFDEWGTGA